MSKWKPAVIILTSVLLLSWLGAYAQQPESQPAQAEASPTPAAPAQANIEEPNRAVDAAKEEGNEELPTDAAQEKDEAALGSPALAALDQLRGYYREFLNHPDNVELRDKIIDLFKTVPAWAGDRMMPSNTRNDFNKASAQLKNASTADDFNAAGKLFEQVVAQAPWYAAAYLGSATAYAKAGYYDVAKRNLALYDTAVRPGADTSDANNLRTNIWEAITAKLEAIRAELKQLNFSLTFTVGYNPAMDVPRERLAGLKVPASFDTAAIENVNQRAAELHAIDMKSAAAAEYKVSVQACDAKAKHFDWRKHNSHFPPVKNQCCGDCFDHAANEVFADSWAIRNNQAIETSVQYVLRCFKDAGDCKEGGWYEKIFDHMISEGTAAESASSSTCPLPEGPCPDVPHPYRAAAWGIVGDTPSPTPAQIKEALCAHGPMATGVYVDDPFQGYNGGVFDEHTKHFQDTNHAITIMGWDDDKIGLGGNRGAWLIKNSWGAWGETGGFGSSKGYSVDFL